MGIADLLGVRSEKLQLQGNIQTMEELYELIKDVPFEAGVPELHNTGFARIIIFPQLDRNNQVQIMGSRGKFTVNRSIQPAGLKNMLVNDMLNEISDGWSSMSGAMGDTKKLCMMLVTKTAETINALGI